MFRIRRGGITMERIIGDAFFFEGKRLRVIVGFCEDCYFNDKSCCLNHYVRDIIGECFASLRRDNEEICFKVEDE